ncbi:carbohydrate ABC transporter permease [Cohnella candidum]|uniref:Carbohydrate ABC transporter permease n=1 Tax=Cohnella candidum TaxID=2674991 RepID=A0A3G3K4Z0_9BACL|nr:carbohydrate ABC transporter permease [Cohnella candidum]AYQ75137.1 carbohydrate ABC transporter permease [Cohnella candidum]
MIEKKSYQIFYHIVLIIMVIIMVGPLLLLFISSITDESALIANGYSFIPTKLSAKAYEYMIANSSTILHAYGITIFVTFIGTILSILITAMMSFAISIENLPGRKVISFFVIFTMLFNGGLVPSYILWTSLDIRNTLWAYVFPFLLTNAFSIILMRSYFAANIPVDIYESAKMDGAGFTRIFFKMVIPLGMPILVTLGLFAGLGYWNDWQNGLYFISDSNMLSIQVLLNKMSQNIQAVISNAGLVNQTAAMTLPQESIRMAIAFVAILPILVVYPFLQKYFASGIMGGAVKG